MIFTQLTDAEKQQVLTILHDNANALLVAMPDGTTIAKGDVNKISACKIVDMPRVTIVVMPRILILHMPGAAQTLDAFMLLQIIDMQDCVEHDVMISQFTTDVTRTVRMLMPVLPARPFAGRDMLLLNARPTVDACVAFMQRTNCSLR